jgi:hypothetical protein
VSWLLILDAWHRLIEVEGDERLAGDPLATEFFLGLGGAEEVGGEFGAAHVVENLFALLG